MNKLITEHAQKAIGRRVPRHDAGKQVTGQICYAEDIRLPGMLHVKFLRSRHAHARILRIDTLRAAAAPGVAAVITGDDVPFNRMGAFIQDQPILANEHARYLGDPVAAVAAATPEAAARAIELIDVEYEVLPAVFDPFQALQKDAPILHGETNILGTWRLDHGDVDAGFAASHMVVEETYRTQIVEQCALETQIAVVVPKEGKGVTVYTPGSRPYAMRADVARALMVDVSDVHILATPSGGAFGGKSDAWVEPACAVLALKTGKPVRAMFTRDEEFFASTVRHPITMRYRSGVSAEGKLLAREVNMYMDTGAYAALGEATLRKGTLLSIGPYRVPNVRVESLLIYTNNTVSSAMRGFGVPQACFAWESHTETIAERLGMDSFEFRMINGYDENDVTSSGQTITSVALKETMLKAKQAFGWERRISQ
ncbi:xanthine dehydrogenase family protein molybdopterin-binding subunit [Pollutimonas bauzanensis]|uniref:Aldehyde oxidase and xanthine dehydrogenase, a/b hammerhead domain n=1 Tax=Pollutimonas bauzanensis TaxID=658167 RepID=A0A1M5QHR3_9BURK|nr:Aldehyde oxidase and xanthine dehydrogenase, a/b hammerhead domain [Pollutimonas bauzanensis]